MPHSVIVPKYRKGRHDTSHQQAVSLGLSLDLSLNNHIRQCLIDLAAETLPQHCLFCSFFLMSTRAIKTVFHHTYFFWSSESALDKQLLYHSISGTSHTSQGVCLYTYYIPLGVCNTNYTNELSLWVIPVYSSYLGHVSRRYFRYSVGCDVILSLAS